ncbi:MAG TPA: stage V sporulation protein AC [Oscillospiraceae bacterium]|nr:stage V sporulation protein AC [Oscillospiraceae bacterium]HPS75477.1 stage V sporulation protein AC [Oscillospiraceae bacterium]
MGMTNDEYKKYADRHAPRSPFRGDVLRAFLVGGAICCLGQLLDETYLGAGLAKDDAGALTSMTLIFLSALLTGLGVYDNLARFGGAGTLVPITGFANAVVSPALEFKTEGFVLGTAAKMFVIAGPVIVFGVGASVVYGLILVLFGVG